MITPSSVTLDGKEIQEFTISVSGLWSSTVGSLFNDAACTIPYASTSRTTVWLLAQNKTSVGTVTGGSDIATVTIVGVLPLTPNWSFQVTPDKRGVILNIKRNGSTNGRILGTGDLVRDYKLGYRNRIQDDWIEYETFFKDHYPFSAFKYIDAWRDITGIFRFDSKPTAQVDSFNKADWETAISEIG
jgi:hypothetical protein